MATSRKELEDSLTRFREYLFPNIFKSRSKVGDFAIINAGYAAAKKQGIWEKRIGVRPSVSGDFSGEYTLFDWRYSQGDSYPLNERWSARWAYTEQIDPWTGEYIFTFQPLQLQITRGTNQTEIREMVEALHVAMTLVWPDSIF